MVMARAGTGIQDAPLPEYWLRIALPNVLGDVQRDVIEMACVEECCPMPQLLLAVATRTRLASPTAQEIDVTLTSEIEAVTSAADKCACRTD
jgi:hypothetical protein